MNFVRKSLGYGERTKKVHLFQHDKSRMKELVLRHPAKETGGNLFGLWTDDEEPVLHIVLGPAIGCTRTEVSFYQSIPYLERVGGLVTQHYQLCHIGEWHSHHRLRLSEPSRGDSSTVLRNFPKGTCGFLLIIANIQPSGEVTLSPYLYREGQGDYIRCEINDLGGQSPFSKLDPIMSHMLQDEDEDTSTTVNEYRHMQRERDRAIIPASPRPVMTPKINSCTYMFQEDQKMIQRLLLESGGTDKRSEGDLFGLWANDEAPLLHIIPPIAGVACEGQPQGANSSGKKILADEDFPFLQKIGKYILHRLPEQKLTAKEESDFRLEFPHRGVLLVAYIVQCNEADKSVGLDSYVYSKDLSHRPSEIKVLPVANIFRHKRKTGEEDHKEREDLMEFDPSPDSPSQKNIWN